MKTTIFPTESASTTFCSTTTMPIHMISVYKVCYAATKNVTTLLAWDNQGPSRHNTHLQVSLVEQYTHTKLLIDPLTSVEMAPQNLQTAAHNLSAVFCHWQ